MPFNVVGKFPDLGTEIRKWKSRVLFGCVKFEMSLRCSSRSVELASWVNEYRDEMEDLAVGRIIGFHSSVLIAVKA